MACARGTDIGVVAVVALLVLGGTAAANLFKWLLAMQWSNFEMRLCVGVGILGAFVSLAIMNLPSWIIDFDLVGAWGSIEVRSWRRLVLSIVSQALCCKSFPH